MKLLSICLFILLSIQVFAQKESNVESKVTAVTIFKNRALVTRGTELNLTPGKHKLIFSNLPADLLNESVRVSVDGSGHTKILDVKAEEKFTPTVQQEDIKGLENQIDSLNQLKGLVLDEIAVNQSKKEFIESLKVQSVKFLNEKMLLNVNSVKNWDDMLQYMSKNLDEIYTKIRGGNNKVNFYNNQIDAIQRQIDLTKGKKTKSYKVIVVIIETDTECTLKIHPSYIVQDASWYPVYDARVVSDSKKVELSYYGMVHQSTGEDWNNISLTLSTAQPMSIKSLPKLERWFIDTNPLPAPRNNTTNNSVGVNSKLKLNYEENYGLPSGTGSVSGFVLDRETGEPLIGANVLVQGTNLGSTTDVNGKFLIPNIPAGMHRIRTTYLGYQTLDVNLDVVEKSMANITLPLPTLALQTQTVVITAERPNIQKSATNAIRISNDKEPKYTDVHASEISTSFEINTKNTIPSNNSRHKVTIAIQELPVQFSYTVIPKITPSVYLSGKIVNPNDYPFLEGEINIFFDNNFVSRSFLKTIVPSDTLELALGIDDKIQVKKVLVNKYLESKGFLEKGNQLTYEYEIQLKNNRKTEETVLIEDQLPIPMNEDIKVELVEPLVEKEKIGNDQKLQWNVKLKPGEKKVIPLKYWVEYPRGTSVYGLE